MIHVVIGTKAQLVKMAPLMAALQDQKIPYNFIFTGQHRETMDGLRENFDVKQPDVTLYEGSDITSIAKMGLWVMRILWHTLWRRRKIFGGDRSGIVLVHGDTFSTLLGALMGRLAGLKVGHVESGLRSFNLWHPFPEELTRVLTFRLADYFFCPGDWAMGNVEKYKGEKINTQYNTLLDSLLHVQKSFSKATVSIPEQKYCVVTTHRFENLVTKDVVLKNLELIEGVAKDLHTIFILHPITKRKLESYGLLARLEENSAIELRERYDYLNFMKLVSHSEFIVTDGGSNQEECFYMGKPCLLLRKASEREEGLGETAVLSKYDGATVKAFARDYSKHERAPLIGQVSPCATIVRSIESFA